MVNAWMRVTPETVDSLTFVFVSQLSDLDKMPKLKCYRIQGIPSATTEDQIKKLINECLPTPLDGPRITLAPCRPRWLTSTVMLQETLETFNYPVDDGFLGITPLHGNELSLVE
jgi:hypothetical protein